MEAQKILSQNNSTSTINPASQIETQQNGHKWKALQSKGKWIAGLGVGIAAILAYKIYNWWILDQMKEINCHFGETINGRLFDFKQYASAVK